MRINSLSSAQYNQINRNNNRQSTPSFKGNPVYDGVTKGLSHFYENVAKTNTFKSFINKFSRTDNSFTHLLVAESCFLSGFYMINTIRNKKIKKEQKPQMVINDALTLGVSTAGAYLVEDKISNVVKSGAEKYFAKHSDFYTELGKKAQEAMTLSPKNELLNKVEQAVSNAGEELTGRLEDISSSLNKHFKNIIADKKGFKAFQITPEKLGEVQANVKNAVTENIGNPAKAKEAVSGVVDDIYNSAAARSEADKVFSGINKLKTLVILGIIYRYLGPVIITPIANKLSSKFFSNKNKEDKVSDKK